jgi:hypothetical protein
LTSAARLADNVQVIYLKVPRMPDEFELPSEEDLKKLSRRAIVAYAARAARRAQPLFRSDNAADTETIERAIAIAEQFASQPDADRIARDATAAASAAAQISTTGGEATMHAAAEAATYAADAAAAHLADDPVADTAHAAHAAAGFARTAYPASSDAELFKSACCADYTTLLETDAVGLTTHTGTPINFEHLGPLWPNGAPGTRNPD